MSKNNTENKKSQNLHLPRTLEEFAALFEKLYPEHEFSWRVYPSRWKGLCPFHSEHNPSFNIFEYDGKLFYKCFSTRCEESGSVFTLLRKHKLISKFEVDEAKEKEWREEEKRNKLVQEFLRECQDTLLEKVKEHLNGDKNPYIEHFIRKVFPSSYSRSEILEKTRELIGFFRIGMYYPDDIFTDNEAERIIQEKILLLPGMFLFPYYSMTGTLTSIKFRDITGSSRTSRVYALYKNIPAFFGGLGFLRDYLKNTDGFVRPLLIVEGETDAMSCFIDCYLPTLAVGSATNLKNILEEDFYDYFPVIFPDFDPYDMKSVGAGRNAVIKLYEERKRKKAWEKKVYVLVDKNAYKGAKDINEAIVRQGVSVEDILNFEIVELREARKRFEEDWKNWKTEMYLRQANRLTKKIPGFVKVYTDYLGISGAIDEEEYEFSIEQVLESETEEYEALLGRFPCYLVSVIASFGGVGKTTFSIMTAYRLAFEYYNPYELKILIWTTEHRPFSLKKRIRQIENILSQEEVEIGRKQIFLTNRIPQHFVNEKKQLNKEAFEIIEKLLNKYDILFLDPLLSFLGCEENDNSLVRAVFDKLHSILGKYVEAGKPKAIIFLHHFNKLAIGNAKIKEEDIYTNSDSIELKYEKVLDLVAAVRGASAVVDSARYCEAIIKTDKARYNVTIKTNEDTRRPGIGEEIPDLFVPRIAAETDDDDLGDDLEI